MSRALADAPCGCDLAAKAHANPDARARAVLLERAEELRTAWGCPETREPTQAQRAAVEALSRLVGEDIEPRGCPMRDVAHPDLHRAVRLHRWWRNGEIAQRGPLSAADIEAVDLIEDSRLRREAWELEEQRRKQSMKARGRGHNR